MKTRLFGSGGIEDVTRQDLSLLIGLPPADVERFITWLSEPSRPIPYTWSEVDQLAEGTTLDVRGANRVLVLLRFLLTNWRASDLSEGDIRADLRAVGYEEADVEKVASFLLKLEGARERVYRAYVKRAHEVRGLPTIDDVNMFWDIRPVFESSAYDTEPESKAYESLVGRTHVLILEVISSPETGVQKSLAYQLSEDDFERLSQAFERAKRQLDVVKKSFA